MKNRSQQDKLGLYKSAIDAFGDEKYNLNYPLDDEQIKALTVYKILQEHPYTKYDDIRVQSYHSIGDDSFLAMYSSDTDNVISKPMFYTVSDNSHWVVISVIPDPNDSKKVAVTYTNPYVFTKQQSNIESSITQGLTPKQIEVMFKDDNGEKLAALGKDVVDTLIKDLNSKGVEVLGNTYIDLSVNKQIDQICGVVAAFNIADQFTQLPKLIKENAFKEETFKNMPLSLAKCPRGAQAQKEHNERITQKIQGIFSSMQNEVFLDSIKDKAEYKTIYDAVEQFNKDFENRTKELDKLRDGSPTKQTIIDRLNKLDLLKVQNSLDNVELVYETLPQENKNQDFVEMYMHLESKSNDITNRQIDIMIFNYKGALTELEQAVADVRVTAATKVNNIRITLDNVNAIKNIINTYFSKVELSEQQESALYLLQEGLKLVEDYTANTSDEVTKEFRESVVELKEFYSAEAKFLDIVNTLGEVNSSYRKDYISTFTQLNLSEKQQEYINQYNVVLNQFEKLPQEKCNNQYITTLLKTCETEKDETIDKLVNAVIKCCELQLLKLPTFELPKNIQDFKDIYTELKSYFFEKAQPFINSFGNRARPLQEISQKLELVEKFIQSIPVKQVDELIKQFNTSCYNIGRQLDAFLKSKKDWSEFETLDLSQVGRKYNAIQAAFNELPNKDEREDLKKKIKGCKTKKDKTIDKQIDALRAYSDSLTQKLKTDNLTQKEFEDTHKNLKFALNLADHFTQVLKLIEEVIAPIGQDSEAAKSVQQVVAQVDTSVSLIGTKEAKNDSNITSELKLNDKQTMLCESFDDKYGELHKALSNFNKYCESVNFVKLDKDEVEQEKNRLLIDKTALNLRHTASSVEFENIIKQAQELKNNESENLQIRYEELTNLYTQCINKSNILEKNLNFDKTQDFNKGVEKIGRDQVDKKLNAIKNIIQKAENSKDNLDVSAAKLQQLNYANEGYTNFIDNIAINEYKNKFNHVFNHSVPKSDLLYQGDSIIEKSFADFKQSLLNLNNDNIAKYNELKNEREQRVDLKLKEAQRAINVFNTKKALLRSDLYSAFEKVEEIEEHRTPNNSSIEDKLKLKIYFEKQYKKYQEAFNYFSVFINHSPKQPEKSCTEVVKLYQAFETDFEKEINEIKNYDKQKRDEIETIIAVVDHQIELLKVEQQEKQKTLNDNTQKYVTGVSNIINNIDLLKDYPGSGPELIKDLFKDILGYSIKLYNNEFDKLVDSVQALKCDTSSPILNYYIELFNNKAKINSIKPTKEVNSEYITATHDEKEKALGLLLNCLSDKRIIGTENFVVKESYFKDLRERTSAEYKASRSKYKKETLDKAKHELCKCVYEAIKSGDENALDTQIDKWLCAANVILKTFPKFESELIKIFNIVSTNTSLPKVGEPILQRERMVLIHDLCKEYAQMTGRSKENLINEFPENVRKDYKIEERKAERYVAAKELCAVIESTQGDYNQCSLTLLKVIDNAKGDNSIYNLYQKEFDKLIDKKQNCVFVASNLLFHGMSKLIVGLSKCSTFTSSLSNDLGITEAAYSIKWKEDFYKLTKSNEFKQFITTIAEKGQQDVKPKFADYVTAKSGMVEIS